MKQLRIPGVLQRLGLSYFGVAAVQVFFARVEDTHRVNIENFYNFFSI